MDTIILSTLHPPALPAPAESAWFFTALDNPTEAKLAAIVRKAAS